MIGALVDHLWQSTLFACAAGLLAGWLRGNSASARHVVWTAASLKFLVPFSVLYLIGARAGLPTPVESQPFFSGMTLDAAAPLTSPAMRLLGRDAAIDFWLVAILCLWSVGVLALLVAWVRDWRASAALCAGSRLLAAGMPDIHVTDAHVEPSVARIISPVVLLPDWLTRVLPRAQFDAVIAHERQHVERRDNLLAQLHRLVEMLFWFHPLVWMIGRRIVDERERACDEAVIAAGHDRAEYAAGILAVCDHCVRTHSPHTVSVLSGNLSRRIGAILAATPAGLGAGRSLLLLSLAFMVTAAPLLAGALDGNLHRQLAFTHNSRAFANARYEVVPATAHAPRLAATEHAAVIGNTSLRELIALVYDVQPHSVSGNDEWLDSMRYDIRAEAGDTVVDPDELDPLALRVLVNKLLADRFAIEIYVNQHCQDPCGPRALQSANAAR